MLIFLYFFVNLVSSRALICTHCTGYILFIVICVYLAYQLHRESACHFRFCLVQLWIPENLILAVSCGKAVVW
jgi:hypothetical protein